MPTNLKYLVVKVFTVFLDEIDYKKTNTEILRNFIT